MAEGKNLYETVIVTSAKLGEEGSAELVNKFKALIAEHGTVESVDDWGKRRFAYPIAKQTEGYYTLINFESGPEFTAELDRRLGITDGILRNLIVKRDPRHVAALNAQKAKAILNLTYGADGTSPVTEAEYTDYVNNDCYYVETVQFPLVNYSSYSLATDDQKSQIEDIAAQCLAELNEQATAETASNSALYTAAMNYVPQAMSAMGSTIESAQAVYYAGSKLYTPDDLSSFGGDGYNNLTDPLDEIPLGTWTTIDLGTTLLVARRIDPLKTYTVDQLNSMYDMLTSMKSDEIQDKLYADGAALEHNLDSSAINTYSASKIKKTISK